MEFYRIVGSRDFEGSVFASVVKKASGQQVFRTRGLPCGCVTRAASPLRPVCQPCIYPYRCTATWLTVYTLPWPLTIPGTISTNDFYRFDSDPRDTRCLCLHLFPSHFFLLSLLLLSRISTFLLSIFSSNSFLPSFVNNVGGGITGSDNNKWNLWIFDPDRIYYVTLKGVRDIGKLETMTIEISEICYLG